MAYGGVAQTYCLWKIDGEPFKENNTLYVRVLHPITKSQKKVRWYTDKKHADLMPKGKDNQYGPLYKVFGFKNAEDKILCIKKSDISLGEEQEYFANKWRFGMFFGGIWYTPLGTSIPPITKAAKVFTPTWTEFKIAGQKHSKALGMVSEAESCWFKEDGK